jgi:hypothetical protein
MFFTCLGREFRRRMRQAVFAALGLAVGIGLVIAGHLASLHLIRLPRLWQPRQSGAVRC